MKNSTIIFIGSVKGKNENFKKLSKILKGKFSVKLVTVKSAKKIIEETEKCDLVITDYSNAKKVCKIVKGFVLILSNNSNITADVGKLERLVTIGRNWSVVDVNSKAVVKKITDQIKISQQQHKLRTNLQKVAKNLKNGSEEEQHVPYYRQLLVLEKNVMKKNTELKKANDELKEIDKLKSVFLSMTSHEIKTPIIPIKMQTENLLSELPGKLNDSQKKALNVILKNINYLNELLSDVLDTAKLQAKKFSMNPKVIKVENLLDEVVEIVKPLAKSKKINLKKSWSSLGKLKIDRLRLRQVMLILLQNSIKFTPGNGEIVLIAKRNSKNLAIKVKDNGIGIAGNQIEKIFEPFVQVAASYKLKEKGTGLGLTICKGIIDQCNGKIVAKSKGINKGTSIEIFIPI